MEAFDTIDCCGNYFPTLREEQKFNGWASMLSRYSTLYHNAVADSVYGGTDRLDKLAKMNFLMVYLDLIAGIREHTPMTRAEAISTYCIENIEKGFRCIGIDIKPLLTEYGLYPYLGDGDDGIGYMSIENTFIIS